MLASVVGLAACLVEPAAAPLHVATAPIDSTRAPAGGGTASVAGRVSGTCVGPILVEAVSGSGTVMGRTTAEGGSWLVPGLAESPALYRWGCDANGDGWVPAAEVAEAGAPRLALAGPVLLLPVL